MACTVEGCACGPGCIHEGCVPADPSVPAPTPSIEATERLLKDEDNDGLPDAPAPDPIVWGRDLEKRKAWVFHAPTMAMGPVEKFFDGVEEQWVSTVNGVAVPGPVLLLATGHALDARSPAVFVEMEAKEVWLAKLAVEKIAKVVAALLETGRQAEVAPRTAALLVLAVLQANRAAIEAESAC